MIWSKKILTCLFLLFCVSCSTKYQPESFFTGGYTEIHTGKDTFIVTFRGNSYTSSHKAYSYAMRRSAELCIKNGYKGFVIVSEEDKSQHAQEYDTTYYLSSHKKHHDKERAWVDSTQTVAKTVTYPTILLKIRCTDAPHYNEDWVDAHYFLANNPV